MGMGTPCDNVDMDLFFVSTITVGNGKIALFWDAHWLNGRKPKDIAPLIYAASTRKQWKVNQSPESGIRLHENNSPQMEKGEIEIYMGLHE
jgi:hypothetical protein